MKNGRINLHGREYKTVALRVSEFRAACPIGEGWGIVSALIDATPELVIFRAAVVDPQGREVATGYAEEKRSGRGINSTSALENCETSAIGRALAAAGWAGQEYCSADELINAIKPPKVRKDPAFVSRKFAARLADLGLRYDQVATFTEGKNWGRPSVWTQAERDQFIGDLQSGKVRIDE